ncbi:NfeD family protein [bacterium]|nr:MAG: NfeD family protein [bacterium]
MIFLDSLVVFFEQLLYPHFSSFTTPEALISLGWFVLGIFVLIIEINMPGLFYCIALACGCFTASVLALLDYSLFSQCLVALGITTLAFASLRSYFGAPAQPTLPTNSEALINKHGIVVKTIETHTAGRVKINGEEWPALSANHTIILQKGTSVRIIGIKGNKVIVKTD